MLATAVPAYTSILLGTAPQHHLFCCDFRLATVAIPGPAVIYMYMREHVPAAIIRMSSHGDDVIDLKYPLHGPEVEHRAPLFSEGGMGTTSAILHQSNTTELTPKLGNTLRQTPNLREPGRVFV